MAGNADLEGPSRPLPLTRWCVCRSGAYRCEEPSCSNHPGVLQREALVAGRQKDAADQFGGVGDRLPAPAVVGGGLRCAAASADKSYASLARTFPPQKDATQASPEPWGPAGSQLNHAAFRIKLAPLSPPLLLSALLVLPSPIGIVILIRTNARTPARVLTLRRVAPT